MKQEEASPKALTTFDGEESKEEGTQLRAWKGRAAGGKGFIYGKKKKKENSLLGAC